MFVWGVVNFRYLVVIGGILMEYLFVIEIKKFYFWCGVLVWKYIKLFYWVVLIEKYFEMFILFIYFFFCIKYDL